MRRPIPLHRLPLPPAVLRWVLILNFATAGLLGGWYLLQPAGRQDEVRRLVEGAFARGKNVTFLEIAWDVWHLYYSGTALGSVAPGDKTFVYGGAPRPAAAGDEEPRVLVNRGYVAGYSERLRNPRWVAYRVRDLPRMPTPKARPEKFDVDRRTASRVASESYAGSGYDRGHMAPNYAIATRYGEAAQRETFLMSNITPQRHALNAGLWRELEMRIATGYPARYGEVWVITGPVFGPSPRTLRGGVAVPAALFKIIIDEQDGKLRTLAFLVPQDAPEKADPGRYLTSIDEIERRTGLDFLAELDEAAQRAVESMQAGRVW